MGHAAIHNFIERTLTFKNYQENKQRCKVNFLHLKYKYVVNKTKQNYLSLGVDLQVKCMNVIA